MIKRLQNSMCRIQNDIEGKNVYFNTEEILNLGINFEVDLVALRDKNLIRSFQYGNDIHPDRCHLSKLTPATLGVQLFAVAGNMLSDYQKFNIHVLNNFTEQLPKAALSPEGIFPILKPTED